MKNAALPMPIAQLKFPILGQTLASAVARPHVHAVALVLICGIPLWFSLPHVSEPYGSSEEGVNAAIWAMGGRNILRLGPVEARLGAKVSPFPGRPGGIYAHHPPLPVWASALGQLVSPWEGMPRLIALLGSMAALVFLHGCLRHFFAPLPALLGVGVAATTPYLLESARMLTTLTLAAPLVLLLLREALRADGRAVRDRWLFQAVIPLAVFSSWDGVLGAGAVIFWRMLQEVGAWRRGELTAGAALGRALLPAGIGLVSLALLAAYFSWVSGGLQELINQAFFRAGAGGGHVPAREFLRSQWQNALHGLGILPLVALAVLGVHAVRGGKVGRRLCWVALVSAVPALGMMFLFKNGAHYHFFWGYNLFAPAGFAAALVAQTVLGSRWQVLAGAALAGQVLWSIAGASATAARDGRNNSAGALVKEYFRAYPVPALPIFSAYHFHPYATWYLDVPIEVATSPVEVRTRLASGQWGPEHAMFACTDFLQNLGCTGVRTVARSSDRRWVVTTVGSINEACAHHP